MLQCNSKMSKICYNVTACSCIPVFTKLQLLANNAQLWKLIYFRKRHTCALHNDLDSGFVSSTRQDKTHRGMRWRKQQIINILTSGPTWVLSSALTSHTHTLSSFLYITTLFHLATPPPLLSVTHSLCLHFFCCSHVGQTWRNKNTVQEEIQLIKYEK